MTYSFFNTIVIIWIALAIILFPLLIKVKAPYGRHSNMSWGPMIDNRTAWMLMELPSLVLFAILFLTGGPVIYKVKWIFFALWVAHYMNRVFIFPVRTRTRGKRMPLIIMLLAMFFNLVNAFINGYWLGYTAHEQDYIPFLLGVGVRTLSVDPQFLPAVQKTILNLNMSKAESFAQNMLEQVSIKGATAVLKSWKKT